VELETDVDESQGRRGTRNSMAMLSIGSTLVMLVVWIDTALTAAALHEKASFRPLAQMLVVLFCLGIGTLPVFCAGIFHLIMGNRRHGLLLLVISAIPYLAFRVSSWIFLDSRGVTFGD
jgi:hypothetical protein